MDDAITWSSNIYFIKLVNENNLYPQLYDIYSKVGVTLNGLPSYKLEYNNPSSAWQNAFNDITYGAIDNYNLVKKGIQTREKGDEYRLTSFKGAFEMAWGQNPLTASPLTMARVSAIVATKGKLQELKLLKDKHANTLFDLSGKGVDSLQSYMQHEAMSHFPHGRSQSLQEQNEAMYSIKHYNTGGKTGTVVRGTGVYRNKKEVSINDAWYICFCDKSNGNGKVAIALRIERSGAGSMKAKQMVRDVVLKNLDEMGYISKVRNYENK